MQDLYQSFHQWWQTNEPIDNNTLEMAKKLTEKHPWFTPSRMISFMHQQADSGNSYYPPTQEFAYNPVRYYERFVATPDIDLIAKSMTAATENLQAIEEETIIQPLHAEDYFRSEGVKIAEDIPAMEELETLSAAEYSNTVDEAKDLMVMMSFGDWLNYFKTKKQEEQDEEASKRALKAHWQKEKLAAALQEEEDEIPEEVFEMAINSIQEDEDMLTESYAEVLFKQGKHEKALAVYHKLSLKFPDKKAFFAARIEKIRELKND